MLSDITGFYSNSMLLTPTIPLPNSEDDPLVTIQYQYVFGSTWEECGVSKADGLLSALGFSTPAEVTAFCFSVNVLKEFSTEEFIKRHINNDDRQRLVAFGKAKKQYNLAPNNLVTFTPVSSIFDELRKPGYEDFFQFLFTWLTHGDTAVKRNNFIAWWQNPAGEASSAVRNPYALKSDSTNIRKSFKEKVDGFLQQLRNPQKPPATEGSNNPFVDAVHYVKNQLLEVLLRPSNWSYVPGYDVTAGVQTPAKLISVGGGGGNFSVFDKSDPKKLFPLRFALGSVGTGFGPSLPLNINVNPEPFPSVGKIYHGLGSNIFGIASFYGAFVTLGAGAADIANQTTSLMFIAPHYALPAVPIPGADGARWAQIFTSVIPLSSAILSLDGNGIEASISVSAQISCGFVGPKK